MFGYGGRILRVDLSSGQVRPENYEKDFARKFLGANGFAAKLIYNGVGAVEKQEKEDDDRDGQDEMQHVLQNYGQGDDIPGEINLLYD